MIRSPVFWVYCAALLAGGLGLLYQLLPVLLLTWRDSLAGAPFVLAGLVVFGGLILHLDRLRAHRWIIGPLVLGFLWGALAGPGVAMWANDHNLEVIKNLAGDAFAINWQAAISAPIVEEAIKGLGVFVVAWLCRSRLWRPIHGLLLGGFTGLGFQVVENATYEANAGLNAAQPTAADAILVGALRFVTGITSHWMLTALAGIGIVQAVARSDWPMAKRVRVFVQFYLLGVLFHFLWDSPQPDDGLALVIVGLRMVAAVLIFALIYTAVLRGERRWFRSTISAAVERGIAPAEEPAMLITRRTRRMARQATRHSLGPGGPTMRDLRRRQRRLIDWVQGFGTYLHQPARVDTPVNAMRLLGP
ncbi:PrsW family intramembrane metalloprotease [Nocardia sp. XZ_19_385]|uniref:PrsW family intramembrane metalloprotease n=1 Tax=Nocardia sp. XZ_19_385 TaxID=2769488 RepID=UPI00188F901F|nr:PrsW family intramembrane metalloprotease [Nocardia sp. XZ_19_385]